MKAVAGLAQDDGIAMTIATSLCFKVSVGLPFDFKDHAIIQDWALLHHYKALVGLAHGIEGNNYEEAIIVYILSPSQPAS